MAPDGTDRFELLDKGPETVVVVVELTPAPDGTAEVVDEEPAAGTGEGGLAAGVPAKLEPVTTTTSALTDRGSREPTSMVLVVDELPRPPPLSETPPPLAPAPLLVSPGS